jgi:hypothetical protein
MVGMEILGYIAMLIFGLLLLGIVYGLPILIIGFMVVLARKEKNKTILYLAVATLASVILYVAFYNPCGLSPFSILSMLLFAIVFLAFSGMAIRTRKSDYILIAISLALIVLVNVFLEGSITDRCSGKTPDLCLFQAGLQCTSFRLSAANDTVDLTIVNGYQQEIRITNATCQVQGLNGAWAQYSPPITISPQQSAKLTVDNIYDTDSSKMNFNPGDIFLGKCVVIYYYTSEGPSSIRRNTADVKLTAQP